MALPVSLFDILLLAKYSKLPTSEGFLLQKQSAAHFVGTNIVCPLVLLSLFIKLLEFSSSCFPFTRSSNTFLWRRSSFPPFVLPQQDVAIGTVVLRHVESGGAERDQGTRDAHSNKTKAGAESPGQHAGTRLDPCPYVVLAVDTGEVDRIVAELGGYDQLRGNRRWGLVDRTNV